MHGIDVHCQFADKFLLDIVHGIDVHCQFADKFLLYVPHGIDVQNVTARRQHGHPGYLLARSKHFQKRGAVDVHL